MFTDDENYLQKFIDYHILIPPVDDQSWDRYFYENLEDVFKRIGYTHYFNNKDIFQERLLQIHDFIRPALPTPRLIKSFGRHLHQKLKRVNAHSKNINFFDLILITIILTINPRLYSWIVQNRRYLINAGISELNTKASNGYRKNIEKKISEIKEQKICNEIELNLLLIIFKNNIITQSDDVPEIHFDLYQLRGKKKICSENRITDNLYFCHYFFSDAIPFIATSDGKDILKMKLKAESENPEMIENFLYNDNILGKKEMIDFFFDTLLEYIKNESDLDLSGKVKLLVATALLMHKTTYNRTRDIIPVIWSIIESVPDENEKIKVIKSLLENNISHEVKSSVIYDISDAPNKGKKFFQNQASIDEIFKIYSNVCKNICFTGEEVNNIFRDNRVVNPQFFLRSWALSADKKETEKYLTDLIKQEPSVLNVFLKTLVTPLLEDYGEVPERLKCKISLESINKLIDENKDSIDEKDAIINNVIDTIR